MSTKAPEAFRTIGEVAEQLDTPAHVLRFWESRFTQIKPVKRAGGRRYYRPADVALLAGIKRLLHEDGMTIRGVQKLLREQGVRHVAAIAAGPAPEEEAAPEVAAEVAPPATLVPQAPAAPRSLLLAARLRRLEQVDADQAGWLLHRCATLHARLRAAAGPGT